ncbi:hypothetical protein PCANC_19320 [Puccinia coronata f. sp. avenae]|uniref:Uncharacterized protein n=1 Tax=Puccinia coronata f. sp. avenae TaxID=200324 RepID=A0A2N5SIJ1_9BASI|nr:hypothetical protein PCANC_19320 [Puccinia coronata f. sp. avenae]
MAAGASVLPEDCRSAAKLILYNSDGTFKPAIEQIEITNSCNFHVHRVTENRVFNRDQVTTAMESVISNCVTHAGLITTPSNATDPGGFQVTLMKRSGHPNAEAMRHMFNITVPHFHCEACAMAKSHRLPFPATLPDVHRPLQMV